MTDLVARLRAKEAPSISLLMDEAADEIERLRGLLAWHDSTVPEILADNTRLRTALGRLVNDSMYKDHPEASQMAIDALNETKLDSSQ